MLTNLVRKWRSGRGVKLAGLTVKSPAARVVPARPAPIALPLLGANAEFVAMEMPAGSKTTASAAARADAGRADAIPTAVADPLIRVELRRGPLHLSVRWPTSAARDCTAWLRELAMGLLK